MPWAANSIAYFATVSAPCPAAAKSSLQAAVGASSWTSPWFPNSSPVETVPAGVRVRRSVSQLRFDPVLHALECRDGGQPLTFLSTMFRDRSFELPTVQRNAGDWNITAWRVQTVRVRDSDVFDAAGTWCLLHQNVTL